MRINIADRTDKDYPEPPECEINGRDCSFRVDNVCHQCGKKMCFDCSVGVRHQPRFSKFTFQTEDGTERIQQHCPDCLDKHTLSMRNLGIGLGGIVVGLLLAVLGGADILPLTVIGVVLLIGGVLMTRYEYRLKVRHNDNHGIGDMF